MLQNKYLYFNSLDAITTIMTDISGKTYKYINQNLLHKKLRYSYLRPDLLTVIILVSAGGIVTL